MVAETITAVDGPAERPGRRTRVIAPLGAALALVCVAKTTAGQSGGSSQVPSRRPPGVQDESVGSRREDRLPVPPLLERLALAPNLTVLDIGAGNGYLTLPIARTLANTGMVYATDFDRTALDHIRRLIQREGLTNVTPVLVARDGLDPFYGSKSFDRIVLSHVFEYLPDPVGYLRALRPSLTKRTGRLFVIHPKHVAGLNAFQFQDVPALFETLTAKGDRFPISTRLGDDLRALVRPGARRPVSPQQQATLVAALRGLLGDPTLYADLATYSYGATKDTRMLLRTVAPSDLELAKWLIVRLDAEGTFAKKRGDIHGLEEAQLRLLNEILLAAVFPKAIVARHSVGNPFLPYLEQGSVLSRLQAAGYTLVQKHDVLPSHLFLELRSDP